MQMPKWFSCLGKYVEIGGFGVGGFYLDRTISLCSPASMCSQCCAECLSDVNLCTDRL